MQPALPLVYGAWYDCLGRTVIRPAHPARSGVVPGRCCDVSGCHPRGAGVLYSGSCAAHRDIPRLIGFDRVTPFPGPANALCDTGVDPLVFRSLETCRPCLPGHGACSCSAADSDAEGQSDDCGDDGCGHVTSLDRFFGGVMAPFVAGDEAAQVSTSFRDRNGVAIIAVGDHQ